MVFVGVHGAEKENVLGPQTGIELGLSLSAASCANHQAVWPPQSRPSGDAGIVHLFALPRRLLAMFHIFLLIALDFFVGCPTLFDFLLLCDLRRPAPANIERKVQACTIGCLV